MYINSSNEKELVLLLSQGNKAAFEELYHLYSKRLLGYLIKLLKSENLAAEQLQETFVRVWNARHDINPDQSFRSYLFRIAENLVYDFFRKAARDRKLQSALIHAHSNQYSHVEESCSAKEREQALNAAINSLPPKRRQVFQLVKIEERSYEEVSELLHVSASTINDHVVKATKCIRARLEGYHMTFITILIFLMLS